MLIPLYSLSMATRVILPVRVCGIKCYFINKLKRCLVLICFVPARNVIFKWLYSGNITCGACGIRITADPGRQTKNPGCSPGPNVTHEKKHCPYQFTCSSVITLYVIKSA